MSTAYKFEIQLVFPVVIEEYVDAADLSDCNISGGLIL